MIYLIIYDGYRSLKGHSNMPPLELFQRT